jgi:hypothetical protein
MQNNKKFVVEIKDDNFIEKTKTDCGKFIAPEQNRNLYNLLNVNFNYENNHLKFTFNFIQDLRKNILISFTNINNKPIYDAIFFAQTGINYWVIKNPARKPHCLHWG